MMAGNVQTTKYEVFLTPIIRPLTHSCLASLQTSLAHAEHQFASVQILWKSSSRFCGTARTHALTRQVNEEREEHKTLQSHWAEELTNPADSHSLSQCQLTVVLCRTTLTLVNWVFLPCARTRTLWTCLRPLSSRTGLFSQVGPFLCFSLVLRCVLVTLSVCVCAGNVSRESFSSALCLHNI